MSWVAHNAGQAGVPGGGFAEFQAALQTWNDESLTPVDYRYAGKSPNSKGFSEYDEVNGVVFGDPNNELPSFSCTKGGVLAYGGPWYEIVTTPHEGQDYHRILNADVVINEGIGCFFAGSSNLSKAAEELFAHEFGHTLGLTHACGDAGVEDPLCDNPELNDALMRAFVHDDGRGGRLNADDQQALRVLYNPALTNVPAAPSELTAVAESTLDITLAWKDNSTNETLFCVEAMQLGGESGGHRLRAGEHHRGRASSRPSRRRPPTSSGCGRGTTPASRPTRTRRAPPPPRTRASARACPAGAA